MLVTTIPLRLQLNPGPMHNDKQHAYMHDNNYELTTAAKSLVPNKLGRQQLYGEAAAV